jgi:hypothetical protein
MFRLLGRLLVMFGVAACVFLLAQRPTGVVVGLLAAVAFVVAWFRFNVKEAWSGLIEANMKTYFALRRGGVDHPAALDAVVASRFPLSPERRSKVLDRLTSLRSRRGRSQDSVLSEAAEVQCLVYFMFCEENGEPPEGIRADLVCDIEETYDRNIAA